MTKSSVSSFALFPENRAKLRAIAKELGVKPNHAINLLIANARIGEVARREPVVTLSAKNNRQAAQDSTGQSSMAVVA